MEAGESHCPVAETARILGRKWTLLILRDLAGGPRRFSELERSVGGISPRTLSERLASLEDQGIINRTSFDEIPPRVEYSLTPKGRDLIPIVEQMRLYGEKWLVVPAARSEE